MDLREFQKQLDQAVAAAYGWTDLQPVHAFILDYQEAAEEQYGAKKKRKEPWRYRWTDNFRDEVLTRLLELNRLRAEEERQAAKPAAVKTKQSRKKKDQVTQEMFTEEIPE